METWPYKSAGRPSFVFPTTLSAKAATYPGCKVGSGEGLSPAGGLAEGVASEPTGAIDGGAPDGATSTIGPLEAFPTGFGVGTGGGEGDGLRCGYGVAYSCDGPLGAGGTVGVAPGEGDGSGGGDGVACATSLAKRAREPHDDPLRSARARADCASEKDGAENEGSGARLLARPSSAARLPARLRPANVLRATTVPGRRWQRWRWEANLRGTG